MSLVRISQEGRRRQEGWTATDRMLNHLPALAGSSERAPKGVTRSKNQLIRKAFARKETAEGRFNQGWVLPPVHRECAA